MNSKINRDQRTLDVYDAQAADYADVACAPESDAQLTAFIAALAPAARVLDLGCGPGHAAAFLRDLGFDVTATDASAEMVWIGRKRFGLDIRVATFSDLSETAVYDGILASFSLLHAPKAEMPTHLAGVHRALKPGGIFSISVKTGEGEHRDTIGRFYAYYSDAEITGLLEHAGFSVSARITGATEGLDGKLWPWIALTTHA